MDAHATFQIFPEIIDQELSFDNGDPLARGQWSLLSHGLDILPPSYVGRASTALNLRQEQ